MLWYTLHLDGKLVSPFTVLYSQRTLVYNISMVSLASRFPVYVLKDRLLDRGNQFTLYFTTKINYLDFDLGLKTQLLDVIKRKWRGKNLLKHTNLKLLFCIKTKTKNGTVRLYYCYMKTLFCHRDKSYIVVGLMYDK